MLDLDFAMRLPELFQRIMNSGNWLDRLLVSIVLGLAGVRDHSLHRDEHYILTILLKKLIEWLINTIAEQELNNRVVDFLSGPGEQYGLFN